MDAEANKIKEIDPFKFCKDLVLQNYLSLSHLSVSLFFLPKAVQKYAYVLIAWAASLDSLADDRTQPVDVRLELIAKFNRKTMDCYSENIPIEPLFIALKDAIKNLQIPESVLYKFYYSCVLDLTVTRYNTFEELYVSLDNSNSPFGRLCLLVYGYKSPEMMEYMDYATIGFQLLDCLIDLKEDLSLGRLLLPLEHLREFHCEEKLLFEYKFNNNVRDLIKHECSIVDKLFRQALPLASYLRKKDIFKFKLTYLCARKLLENLRKADYDVFNNKITLTFFDKVKMLLKALITSNDPEKLK